MQAWHSKSSHRRVLFYSIPAYSSWLNLVEVLFNLLQAKVLRRGVFPSEESLVGKILDFIPRSNEQGRAFHWTRPAQAICRSPTSRTEH